MIALATTFVVPALRSVSGANARKAAGELAGSMRALFDIAALRHATCRMALDLDGGAWWAECAPGRAGIARDPERAESLSDRFPRSPTRRSSGSSRGRSSARSRIAS